MRGTHSNGSLLTAELGNYNNWLCSEKTDIAILELPHIENHKYNYFTPAQFADKAYLSRKDIGTGDEVFFVGLLSPYPGSKKLEPIVRFGSISIMPGEHIAIKNADNSTTNAEAFLVEVLSAGGISGSPAFVWLNPTRRPGFINLPPIQIDEPLPLDVAPRLLGLVSGHFDMKQIFSFSHLYDAEPDNYTANSGISIVVPAYDILRELNDRDLVGKRMANCS